MTHESPPFRYEISIDEWMETLPAGLSHEPVGMWEIVPAGRSGFGLEEHELFEFVRRAVRRLVEYGARPVKRKIHGPYYWAVQTHYGETADEIVENIIADWLGWGYGDPTHVGLWFASPQDCEVRNMPVSEWLERLPAKLGKWAVSVSEIVMAGQHDYGLDGDSLARFIEDAVRRLLEHGAVPVKFNPEGPHAFTADGRFGKAVEEIVSNVVVAWNASQDPFVGGLDFATREIYEARRD